MTNYTNPKNYVQTGTEKPVTKPFNSDQSNTRVHDSFAIRDFVYSVHYCGPRTSEYRDRLSACGSREHRGK